MAAIRLDMTVSLDGYVAGPDDSVEEPMGRGGFRLFDWLDRRDDPGPKAQVYAELMATRAVIVQTHDVPAEPPPGSVRYVTPRLRALAVPRASPVSSNWCGATSGGS